jgi:hypothetical protein
MSKTNSPVALIEFEAGSSMAGLTEKQQKFVIAKVHHGMSNADAARAAGYSDSSPGTLSKSAYQCAHRPGVQAAILQEARGVLRTEGPKSILALVEIRDDKAAKHADRIRAAELLLNRGGFNAVSESHLTVEHLNLSDADKDREILRLARELGLGETDAKKLLIAPDDFTKNSDGAFELPPEPVDPEVAAVRARKREDKRRQRAREKMTPEDAAADKARVHEASMRQLDAYWATRIAQVTDVEEAVALGPSTSVTEYVDINLLHDLDDVL